MHSRLTTQPERGAAAIAKAFRAMPAIAESHVEEAKLAWLGELGFAAKAGPDIGPDDAAPESRPWRCGAGWPCAGGDRLAEPAPDRGNPRGGLSQTDQLISPATPFHSSHGRRERI
jgi:hypothetical protein